MRLMMNRYHTIRLSAMVALIFAVVVSVLPRQSAQADQAVQPAAPSDATSVYLPALFFNHPWESPFGVESYDPLTTGGALYNHTVDLNSRWVRLGSKISWRLLQPDENMTNAQILANMDALLTTFENELRSLRSSGIIPVVVIKDSPYWAVENVWIDPQDPTAPPQPTSCGPIRTDKFAAFANFVGLLVDRYSKPEFNVHHWEIGNEPDADPNIVPRDYGFGCWGEPGDLQYYGGDTFGEMLKVVSPVIRQEDPGARIWLGGLLLGNPNPTPQEGNPQNFLRGVLAAGAASHFDILPYHWHPSYYPDYDPNTGIYTETTKTDFDISYHAWDAYGSGVTSKAQYIRQILSDYGVSKPLVLNETGFGCASDRSDVVWCSPPSSMFFSLQADMLVRMAVRGMSVDLKGYVWYSIDEVGWRNSGLLDEAYTPRPAYYAYQELSQQLKYTSYQGPVNYLNEVEAYEFQRKTERVHVAWAKTDQTFTIQVPASKFKAAYDINGTQLNPPLVGANYEISVGFTPVYVIRYP